MAFKPSQITKQNILDAINKIEHENINLIKATRWQVIINNKPYPPKEVMRLAHEQMNGERIWEYGGGEGTNKFLKKFGFKLIDMQEDSIKKIIEEYKIHIQDTQLNDEKYKWKILSQYKGRPNLDATDFLQELKSINYSNLIYAMGKAVVFHLASEKPIELKEMFRNLFDESIGLSQRIKTFNQEALSIYRSLGEKLQHHQDERTIGTYLTFHNPEKYTFYKNSFYKKMCELLNEREAKKNEKYEHYLFLVNRIIEDYIQDDNELIDLVKTYIPDYYDGSNHLLLTQDILYQMLDKRESVNYWLYAPGENAHKWEEFYENGIMGLGWDDLGDLNNYKTKNEIKEKLQELENVDSSKQNDTAANYEFHKVIKEGDIIIVKKGISELLGYGEVISDYFYDETRDSYQKCREVDWKLKGNWKVDFNLPVKTLTDVTKYPTEDPNYSKYYEKLMAIMENPINSKSNEKDVFNFNIPLNQILYGPPGTGKTYTLQNKYFEKFTIKESSLTREQYLENLVSELNWWQVISIAVLDLQLTKVNDIHEHEIVKAKEKISDSKTVRPTIWGQLQRHTILDCEFVNVKDRSEPLYFNKDENSNWSIDNELLTQYYPESFDILNGIQNFTGNEAVSIKNYEFITFHQSFSYEDFIEGIKPKLEEGESDLSFEIKDGVFKKLCLKAEADPENDYALFIDEINRGNVSAIFGELITLIETDKRLGNKNELKVRLPYSKKEFGVPSNVYIIGTMNTADRSVEALDTALRRRFSFVEMMPNEKIFDSLNFTDTYERKGIMQKINQRIEVLLDRNYTLGHSYFIKEDFKNSFENEIIPLLQEYFYNDYGKIGLVLGKGFVREKAITAKNDKSIFADFDTKNEVDINKSYELIPFTEFNFDEVIKTLLA